jgi:hypothetical protein
MVGMASHTNISAKKALRTKNDGNFSFAFSLCCQYSPQKKIVWPANENMSLSGGGKKKTSQFFFVFGLFGFGICGIVVRGQRVRPKWKIFNHHNQTTYTCTPLFHWGRSKHIRLAHTHVHKHRFDFHTKKNVEKISQRWNGKLEKVRPPFLTKLSMEIAIFIFFSCGTEKEWKLWPFHVGVCASFLIGLLRFFSHVLLVAAGVEHHFGNDHRIGQARPDELKNLLKHLNSS